VADLLAQGLSERAVARQLQIGLEEVRMAADAARPSRGPRGPLAPAARTAAPQPRGRSGAPRGVAS